MAIDMGSGCFIITEEEYEEAMKTEEWDVFDDDDDIPEGCSACGGDYPHCMSSCSLFDD